LWIAFDPIHKRANADIAQLVEQVIRNDQVVGSNPTIGFFAIFQLSHDLLPYVAPPGAGLTW
jgi:hypothetical protein